MTFKDKSEKKPIEERKWNRSLPIIPYNLFKSSQYNFFSK